MAYQLGIDIGTSYTTAAVSHDGGRAEVVALGARANSIPSVVSLADDGSFLVGESAARRLISDPESAAGGFKRKLGDNSSIILRTSPFSAEQLYARTLEYVVGRVSQRQGGPPGSIVVTHPENWGPYKRELFAQALRISNFPAKAMTDVAAVAQAYATGGHINTGENLAVYALGGGTFDAAVFAATPSGFQTLGTPKGVCELGGVDFDAAVIAWVRRASGDAWPDDADSAESVSAMHHLRNSCFEAKELLSTERDVLIPVLLPSASLTLTLTRNDFEQLIRTRLEESFVAFESTLASAGVAPMSTPIALAGGSTRVPLVRSELERRFGPILSNTVDPLHAVALGAATALVA